MGTYEEADAMHASSKEGERWTAERRRNTLTGGASRKANFSPHFECGVGLLVNNLTMPEVASNDELVGMSV